MKQNPSHRSVLLLHILVAVSLFSFCACKEEPVVEKKPPVVVNPEPDPEQYGTPYAGVPDPRDATIYQVNIRSFSDGRNFQGVTARLDSIRALGVNVIYLMPVYPVGTLKAINSPYCIKDYRSVNSEFGSLADLRALIDGAHSRGMAVILDWVANHTAWDNAWIGNPGWYVTNSSGTIQSPNGWNDVAQLNFANPDMRKAMIRAMKYWVLTANCDGFRCDYADGPPADFWKQALDSLRTIRSHNLLMLAEGTRANHFNAGFDYTFGFGFYGKLKSVFGAGQPATGIDELNNSEYTTAGTANRVVRYLTNHDVNSSDGTALDLFGGAKGSMAAFVVAAYMKGVPMLYNGQEVGTNYRLTFPFTGSTIRWNQNQPMVEEYKKIIALRNRSEAIRRGEWSSVSTADVCAFTKTGATETVLVVSNVRNSAGSLALPAALTAKTWKDAFSDIPVSLPAQLPLASYEYRVFTTTHD